LFESKNRLQFHLDEVKDMMINDAGFVPEKSQAFSVHGRRQRRAVAPSLDFHTWYK